MVKDVFLPLRKVDRIISRFTLLCLVCATFFFTSLLLVWNDHHLKVIHFINTRFYEKQQFAPIVCSAKRHVTFLKVHKSGSTSISNILIRYAVRHNITVLVPRTGTQVWVVQNARSFNILPPPKGRVYEMVASHTNYDRRLYKKWLPADSIKLAILRHPLSHLQSCLYYITVMSRSVSGPQKLHKYLDNPKKYDKFERPWAINSMPYEFDVPMRKMNNMTWVTSYVKRLSIEFDLIMIVERFAESVILLKRLLCWNMSDIVTLRLNVNAKRPNESDSLPLDLVQKHQLHAKADYYLYYHFLDVLDKKVKNEGPGFLEEVATYKIIAKQIQNYCNSKLSNSTLIPASAWNEAFTINKTNCEVLRYEDVALVNLVHKTQYKKRKK